MYKTYKNPIGDDVSAQTNPDKVPQVWGGVLRSFKIRWVSIWLLLMSLILIKQEHSRC